MTVDLHRLHVSLALLSGGLPSLTSCLRTSTSSSIRIVADPAHRTPRCGSHRLLFALAGVGAVGSSARSSCECTRSLVVEHGGRTRRGLRRLRRRLAGEAASPASVQLVRVRGGPGMDVYSSRTRLLHFALCCSGRRSELFNPLPVYYLQNPMGRAGREHKLHFTDRTGHFVQRPHDPLAFTWTPSRASVRDYEPFPSRLNSAARADRVRSFEPALPLCLRARFLS